MRVKRAVRDQVPWRAASWVPRAHRVRAVWASVAALDLTPLERKIQAVAGGELRSIPQFGGRGGGGPSGRESAVLGKGLCIFDFRELWKSPAA